MPRRAQRACLTCGQLTRVGSRCQPCATRREHQRDQRRGTSTQRGYDHQHRTLSQQAIARHPWCLDCGTEGSPTNPLTGQHKRWPATTVDDYEVLCRRCNSARGPLRGRLTGHTDR